MGIANRRTDTATWRGIGCDPSMARVRAALPQFDGVALIGVANYLSPPSLRCPFQGRNVVSEDCPQYPLNER